MDEEINNNLFLGLIGVSLVIAGLIIWLIIQDSIRWFIGSVITGIYFLIWAIFFEILEQNNLKQLKGGKNGGRY